MQKVSEDAGITAFIDKRGRSWNMASYTDMLCRTSSMQIFHQAKTNEYLAHGEDLVIVSSHYPTCDKCAPWNGKVLSLTDETPGYPTMEEAKAAGLFHPNCRHTYGLYISGDKSLGSLEGGKEEKKRGKSPFEELGIKGTENWKYITGEHSASDDAKATNPNFFTGKDEYLENCQRCVVAYEMRRRGLDVVAKPAILNGKDKMITGNGWKYVFYDAEFVKCTKGSGKEEITSMLEKWGDGACAEIIVKWNPVLGHAFIGENIKGKVFFIDPQNGDADVSSYFDRAIIGETRVCRIDNLSTTNLVEECCEERK